MTEKFVDGEVWINNLKTNAKLSPYFCKYGFWLSNRAGGFGGPHTEIKINPEEFASNIVPGTDPEIEFSMTGDNLGKIDECSGYAAQDVGSHTRKISRYKCTITRDSKSTKFVLEGETGFLDASTVAGAKENDLHSRGRYEFRIWFLIPDNDLQLFFKDEQALAAMQRYILQNQGVSGQHT